MVSLLVGEFKRLFREMSPTSHLENKPSGAVSTDSTKQVTNNSEILQSSCAPASPNSSSWKGEDVDYLQAER